jgi:hypothetical protein
MVSIWLTTVKTRDEIAKRQKTGVHKDAGFLKIRNIRESALLAILLDTGGAQPGKAMLVDRELPGKEFIDGQRVAAACFLKREQAAADGGNNFSLPPDHPPFGAGRR